MPCGFCLGQGVEHARQKMRYKARVDLVKGALAEGHYGCLVAAGSGYRFAISKILYLSEYCSDHVRGLLQAGYDGWKYTIWGIVLEQCMDWPDIFEMFLSRGVRVPNNDYLMNRIHNGIGAQYIYTVAGFSKQKGTRLGAIRVLARLGLWQVTAWWLHLRWRDLEDYRDDRDLKDALREGLNPGSTRLTVGLAGYGDTPALTALVEIGYGWWEALPGLEYRHALAHDKSRYAATADKTVEWLIRLGCPVDNGLLFAAEAGRADLVPQFAAAGARPSGGEIAAALLRGHLDTALDLAQKHGCAWDNSCFALALRRFDRAGLAKLVAAGCPVQGDELTYYCSMGGAEYALPTLRELRLIGGQRPRGDEPALLAIAGRGLYDEEHAIWYLRAEFGCRPACDQDVLDLLCHVQRLGVYGIKKGIKALGVAPSEALVSRLPPWCPPELRKWLHKCACKVSGG